MKVKELINTSKYDLLCIDGKHFIPEDDGDGGYRFPEIFWELEIKNSKPRCFEFKGFKFFYKKSMEEFKKEYFDIVGGQYQEYDNSLDKEIIKEKIFCGKITSCDLHHDHTRTSGYVDDWGCSWVFQKPKKVGSVKKIRFYETPDFNAWGESFSGSYISITPAFAECDKAI